MDNSGLGIYKTENSDLNITVYICYKICILSRDILFSDQETLVIK